jgi:hypothetical protein
MTGEEIKNLTDDEKRRLAASLLGSINSEKKRQAARANGFKLGHDKGFKVGHPGGPGREPSPLFDSICTCGAGNVIDGQKSKCPRYHLVFKQRKLGHDVMTGRPKEGASLTSGDAQ